MYTKDEEYRLNNLSNGLFYDAQVARKSRKTWADAILLVMRLGGAIEPNICGMRTQISIREPPPKHLYLGHGPKLGVGGGREQPSAYRLTIYCVQCY